MNFVSEIFFPIKAQCLGCGSMVGNEAGFLCEKCRRDLVPIADAGYKLCPVCMSQLDESEKCRTCFSWPDGLMRAKYAYQYHGPAGGIVRAGKYSGVYRVFDWCSTEMIEKCGLEAEPRPDMIVPVPMYWLKKRIRGFNQAEVIARYLSEHTGIPLSGCLRRVKWTKAQAKLSGEKRRKNLAGAFRCTWDAAGKRIWLVDDVRTTGKTALECAAALKDAGAKDILLITFAG